MHTKYLRDEVYCFGMHVANGDLEPSLKQHGDNMNAACSSSYDLSGSASLADKSVSFLCVCVCVCVCVFSKFRYVCVCVCVCVCLFYVSVCICLYMYIHIHMHIYDVYVCTMYAWLWASFGYTSSCLICSSVTLSSKTHARFFA